MSTDYVKALYQNINTFMKLNGLTQYNWIRVQLPIIAELYESYPEPLPQSDFIGTYHNRMSICRAVEDLKDTCKFITVEKRSDHKGAKNNYLSLTPLGVQFFEYIKPDQETTND